MKCVAWRLPALLTVLALAMAGCGDDDDSGDQAAAGGTTAQQEQQLQTIEQGKLTVGSDIPYTPFEFGRAPDYEGFDVDVVNELGRRLNLDVEIRKTPFDTIFRDLAQGKFDMVASAVTITEERQKQVDFSDPYFAADQSLMVKKGGDIRTVDDLAGETVGAQIGTTGADYARERTEAEDVRTYDVIDDAFQALEAGQVAAVINDFPVSKYAEREHANLEVVQTIETGEQYGLAFEKGNAEIQQAVNDALQAMKDDGTYADIYRRWFEQDPPESITGAGAGGSGTSTEGS